MCRVFVFCVWRGEGSVPCCSEVSEVSDAFFFASKVSLQASGFGRGSGGWGPDYQYYFGVFFIIVILYTPKPYY